MLRAGRPTPAQKNLLRPHPNRPVVPSIARILRRLEIASAVAVLGMTAVLVSGRLPQWSAWPEIAEMPVSPELLVPAALSLAVLCRIPADGVRVGSLLAAPLAAITLWISVAGWYVLWVDVRGGVFVHGLLSLAGGLGLAGLVLLRAVLPDRVGLESRLQLRERVGR